MLRISRYQLTTLAAAILQLGGGAIRLVLKTSASSPVSRVGNRVFMVLSVAELGRGFRAREGSEPNGIV